jgi:hypothetical protein
MIRFPIIFCVLMMSVWCCGAAPARNNSADIKLHPNDPTAFFISPDKPAELIWKAPGRSSGETLTFQWSDYTGHVLATHPAQLRPDHTVALPITLPAGFYTVHCIETGQEFGVVTQPPHEGKADPYFGMDSVLSWLEPRQDIREALIRILHRSGIAISRDRVAWSHINSERGKWNWQAVDRYQSLRDQYTRLGMPVLELFHDSPMWVRSKHTNQRYPIDLVATADSWLSIAHQWQSAWGGLEIWNEPEGLYGARRSADQYIPIIKTIAYAYQQAGIHVPLGGGVFMGEYPSDFHEACARNGMLDQVNFVSFHTYHGPTELTQHVRQYRQWLKHYGKESMPLWITESGEPWKAGTDRPHAEDDAHSALSVAMKAVQARACGVARYFPFDYPFYVEGPKNFSLMGREETPLRSLAAYVQCVAALSDQSYQGDLRVDDPAIHLSPVFGNDTHCVAVLYTGNPDPKASCRVNLDVSRIEGIDGRNLARNPDGSIPIPDGMVYLYGDAKSFGALVESDTEAAALTAIAHQPPPVRPSLSPIVLQPAGDIVPSIFSQSGYLLQESAARQLNVQAVVWNLSDQPRTVRVTLQLPGENQPAHTADPVTVPARQSMPVGWTIDAAASLDIQSYRYVTITAESPGGGKISPLAIPLILEGGLEQNLARHAWTKPLAISDLTRWQKNIAPFGRMALSSTGERGLRMEISFSKRTDMWVYPKFKLDFTPDMNAARGLVVRARAANEADVRIMFFSKGTGTYWTSQPIIPADNQWHVAYVPFARLDPLIDVNAVGQFDLSRIDGISVGMHNRAKSNANTLDVSDVALVGQDESHVKPK